MLTYMTMWLTIGRPDVNISFVRIRFRPENEKLHLKAVRIIFKKGKDIIMKTNRLYSTIYIGLCAALTAVCSQIQIPAAVPFTLQTFAVFLACGLLGGKRGTVSVLIYILLGAVGLPVFAGFKGGIGALLGTTGGYIIGFLFTALVMWLFEKVPGKKMILLGISMICGLLVCYAFGTAWFILVYTNTKEPVGIMTALSWCVFPFIIPDMVKIALALALTSRLRKLITFRT